MSGVIGQAVSRIDGPAKVTGSASVGIDFNPNYAPAPPAARLIN